MLWNTNYFSLMCYRIRFKRNIIKIIPDSIKSRIFMSFAKIRGRIRFFSIINFSPTGKFFRFVRWYSYFVSSDSSSCRNNF